MPGPGLNLGCLSDGVQVTSAGVAVQAARSVVFVLHCTKGTDEVLREWAPRLRMRPEVLDSMLDARNYLLSRELVHEWWGSR